MPNKKNQGLVMVVQNLILILLLTISQQSLIYSHIQNWPLLATIGLIIINLAAISITGFLIVQQDKTTLRKQQYSKMNIQNAFNKEYHIGYGLCSIIGCLVINILIYHLFPVTQNAVNVQALLKTTTNTYSNMTNIILIITIYVLIGPIIEEMIFRQLLPMLKPSQLMFIIANVSFVLLHSPNTLQQIVTLGFTTTILLVNRMRYNIIQGILIHQILNFVSIAQLIWIMFL